MKYLDFNKLLLVALVAFTIVTGGTFPSALVTLGLMAMMFLQTNKKDDISKEIEDFKAWKEKVQSLESKLSLMNSRKM